MLNLSLKREVVKLGRVVPSLRKIPKLPKWIKPVTKTVLKHRMELAEIAEKSKLIRIHRLKAKRFIPQIPYIRDLVNISLEKRCSILDIDEWVSREEWDGIKNTLEDMLTKRIKGVFKRQQRRGYEFFGMMLHEDKKQISGDEIVDVDHYISTGAIRFNADTGWDEIIRRVWIELHLKLREILEDYRLHLDRVYVCGITKNAIEKDE
jgi:hypothetical protein